eukprot:3937530-Rhodomonas_salina.2
MLLPPRQIPPCGGRRRGDVSVACNPTADALVCLESPSSRVGRGEEGAVLQSAGCAGHRRTTALSVFSVLTSEDLRGPAKTDQSILSLAVTVRLIYHRPTPHTQGNSFPSSSFPLCCDSTPLSLPESARRVL